MTAMTLLSVHGPSGTALLWVESGAKVAPCDGYTCHKITQVDTSQDAEDAS